jgi:hypothetical protein
VPSVTHNEEIELLDELLDRLDFEELELPLPPPVPDEPGELEQAIKAVKETATVDAKINLRTMFINTLLQIIIWILKSKR